MLIAKMAQMETALGDLKKRLEEAEAAAKEPADEEVSATEAADEEVAEEE